MKIKENFLKQLWNLRLDIILLLLFLLVTTSYALFLLNNTISPLWLIILGAFWLIYWVFSGRLSLVTPMDIPILILFCLLLLSLSISIDLSLSQPKAIGLVLSFILFYVVVNFVHNKSNLRLAIFGLIFLTFLLSFLAILSSNWSNSNFQFLSIIQKMISQSFDWLPASIIERGINVNTFAGVFTFFIPLLFSLIFDKRAFTITYTNNDNKISFAVISYKIILLILLILSCFVLMLTQSRGGLIGSALGVLAFLIWRDRRFLWLIPIALIGLFILVLLFTEGDLSKLMTSLIIREGDSITGRIRDWKYILYMIRDFPLTGAGIGTFSKIFSEIYSFNPNTLSGINLYAHNNILSVAVDLGISALVLYLSLLSAFACMVYYTLKNTMHKEKVVAVGLACGMLAHQIFGIFDSFALGSNLGVVMWIYFGLVAALYIHDHKFDQVRDRNHLLSIRANWQNIKRLGINLLFGLFTWILFSLLSVTFVFVNIYISLGLAIIGGIILGILFTRRFELSKILVL